MKAESFNIAINEQDMTLPIAHQTLDTPFQHVDQFGKVYRALSLDRRFLLIRESELEPHKMKKVNPWPYLVVGFRKYAVRHRERGKTGITWVFIDRDEYSQLGRCGRCGIPLTWSRVKGWNHPLMAVSSYSVLREEVELDPSFFDEGKQ